MKSLEVSRFTLCVLIVFTVSVAWAGPPRDKDEDQQRELLPLPKVAPSPPDNPTSKAKIELGRMLFFDPRLSGTNKMSCATCHLPDKAFADGKKVSLGADGKPLKRNTQSLLNVAFFKSYFWDGRSKSLEDQALRPIEAKDEMNQDLGELEQELREIPGYVAKFRTVFKQPPNRRGIAQALAAFQRTLITGPSPFDRYLKGDKKALSPSAIRGYELFQNEAGCIRCHHGVLLSDEKYYRLGVAWKDRGRGAVTGKRPQNFAFRTPTLRNIAETAPYMHNGSMKTLDDVVTFYYRSVPRTSPDGLPLDLEPLDGNSFTEIFDIVEFLKSLSGAPPKIEAPKLPQ